MQDLKEFLDGKFDYKTACDLYDKYGDNTRLKTIYRSGETKFNCECLIYDLSKILNPPIAKVIAQPAPSKPIPSPVFKEQAIDPELQARNPHAVLVNPEVFNTPPTDPKLAELIRTRSDLYVRRAKISNRLLDMNDNKRAEAVKEIDALTAQYLAAQQAQRAYESGAPITPKTESAMISEKGPKKVNVDLPKADLITQMRSQQSARSRMRKILSQLHASTAEYVKAENALRTYDENIAALDAAIKTSA
jgi:hypothetical protein